MNQTRYVGRSLPRLDAAAKVTGEALFPGDLSMPDMAHMKVLFAHRPHARILRIDTSQAEALPGVLAVLTAKDVPVNSYGIAEFDQPVLCGEVVRFVGDRVALVVAETPEIARQACDLIEVEYEDLPVITGPEEALAPDAPLLHPEKGSNVLATFHVRKGDIEEGFAQADVIVEETYTMGMQEHAYLQPDAGLAWVDEDGYLVVKTGGQWAHDDRRQIAHSLDLPEDRIRVIYTYVGGAFGGREDVTVQVILALAAWKLRRPVKIVWSREETTIGHHKRHPMRIRHRWGATREGRIVAQETEILADAGAYASTSSYVVASTVLLSTGPYEVPNLWLDARAVYTNNIPCGAFRGFGVPQAMFAAEAHMARLADALGMDPVELRMRNGLEENSLTGTMAEIPPGLSVRETLEAAARRMGWELVDGEWRRPQIRREVRPGVVRGIGIASGWKNVGYTLGYPEQATVTVELHGEAEVERGVVRLATSEVGQGTHTTIAQMAAEALKLPLERIEIVYTDTAQTHSAGSVSASRMAFMAGNALLGAAREAYKAWDDEDRPAVATYTYRTPPTEPLDPETGHGKGAFAFAYLAQAVEVEVDTETGKVEVKRIVAAHDVGKAINPEIVEGQIEGGAIQALGWATLENFVMQDGEVLTPDLSTYLIPTVLDIPPDFETLILENPLPLGPWGATGVGEMGFLSIAPAIIDAVHDATGVWFNAIPLTPEKVLDRLKGEH
ncbi:MAG TPA: xanthine dehydrogenase family protein molybdopterin-binding subunit [Chloroflexi bacterium]|nr:xanthine dehydrogenase family protein molybdopterin-binding subunit [Chloroflexota bacterium]